MPIDDIPTPSTKIDRPNTLVRWALLLVMTLVMIRVLKYFSIPAYILLGAMASAVTVSVVGGGLARPPRPIFFFSQGVVGCLIGRSISPDTLRDILERWPLFVLMVLSVSVAAGFLGWLLARTGVLPGTTAVWGTSPGAALVMVVMSEGYGADSRLVAFMQYLRVLMVTLTATAVARFAGGGVATLPTAAADWFPATHWPAIGHTMLLAAAGAALGMYTRFTAAPMIFPLAVGGILGSAEIMRIELPWWLLTVAYVFVGWGIGLRFTRGIVRHALKALPKVLVTTMALIGVCGLMGAVFGRLAGIDPMTAYLATSPGGMDSVAIIAVSTSANLSVVMAVQTTRFILVTVTGPAVAGWVARHSGMMDAAEASRNPPR